MKFIKKTREPESFSSWKEMANADWQPSWNNLRDDNTNTPRFTPKADLHKSLISDQGYICCYCGRRIYKDSSHIEHFKPRQKFPALSLDYSNLLASCPGYLEEEDSKALTKAQLPQSHCGQKKGNWYDPQLTVSPLIESCEEYFRYTASGEILPASDPNIHAAAKSTISELGLDHPGLERARKKVIEEILFLIEGLDSKEIEELISIYEEADERGEYVRFCSTILVFLKSLI